MVVVQKVVQKVVWNLFFEVFVVSYGIFRNSMVFGTRIYVGFYVWSSRGDDGGQHVQMCPLLLTGFVQFRSDFVETWMVRC